MKTSAFILMMILLLCKSYGQHLIEEDYAFENYVQRIFQMQEEELNYEEMYETLLQFYQSPLNLNSVQQNELESLHILSMEQIRNLLDHRRKFGNLISIYELQVIPAFDDGTIALLLPFVRVVPASNNSVIQRTLQLQRYQTSISYFLVRASRTLEKKKGFTNGNFKGSQERLLFRLKKSLPGIYSIGLIAEKDAGESYSWEPKRFIFGADYLSFHFSIQNKKKIQCLLLGDYTLQFGQGLVLGSGLRFGKGAETITTIKRNNLGIRSYNSVYEDGFFRGMALTLVPQKSISITAFLSTKNIDATSYFADSTDVEYFNSVYNAGLHRTQSEINKRNKVAELSSGGNLLFKVFKDKLQWGVTGIYTHYSIVRKPSEDMYKKFDFHGQENMVIGSDFSFTLKNSQIFGEIARSSSNGFGLVSGLLSTLHPKVDISFLFRSFSPYFHSFYANSFSENSEARNETGFYCGIKIKPIQKLNISAYFDSFEFPWLKYQVKAPSKGNETLLRFDFSLSKRINAYIQLKTLEKEITKLSDNQKLPSLVIRRKLSFLCQFNYKSLDNLLFQTRIQTSTVNKPDSKTYGYYMMAELGKSIGSFKLDGRFAIFQTDDFDNRQYSFEKDVLYSFSLPFLYQQGTRYYLIAQYRISHTLSFWIRFSRTFYDKIDVIGSGLDEIKGNKISEIKIQLLYKL